MARNARASGFTLVEAVVAMAVLTIGAVGVTSLESMGPKMNADARTMTRATAIAQDLVSQVLTWNYLNDPRLQNVNTDNDADVADGEFAFQGPVASLPFDHQESELEATDPWLGIPTATVEGLGFSATGTSRRTWIRTQGPRSG